MIIAAISQVPIFVFHRHRSLLSRVTYKYKFMAMSESDNFILLVYTVIYPDFSPTFSPTSAIFSSIKALFRANLTNYIDFLCTFLCTFL